MTVFWTRNAKRELQAIYDYIAQNSPLYAQGMVDRITRKTLLRATYPNFGVCVAEYEDAAIREIFEHPYRIIYQIQSERIIVLSVVHGVRQLPARLPDGE